MVRFELTVRFPARRFSKPLPSTAQPHLQQKPPRGAFIKVALFCIFGKKCYTAQVSFGPIVYRLGRKLFKL